MRQRARTYGRSGTTARWTTRSRFRARWRSGSWRLCPAEHGNRPAVLRAGAGARPLFRPRACRAVPTTWLDVVVPLRSVARAPGSAARGGGDRAPARAGVAGGALGHGRYALLWSPGLGGRSARVSHRAPEPAQQRQPVVPDRRYKSSAGELERGGRGVREDAPAQSASAKPLFRLRGQHVSVPPALWGRHRSVSTGPNHRAETERGAHRYRPDLRSLERCAGHAASRAEQHAGQRAIGRSADRECAAGAAPVVGAQLGRPAGISQERWGSPIRGTGLLPADRAVRRVGVPTAW